MKTSKIKPSKQACSVLAGSLLLVLPLMGQDAKESSAEEDDVFVLSPFEVSGDSDQGYRATSTMAGTRIATNLSDIGTAISVLTEDFIRDVGAIDNETVLSYALNIEVGGARGNYSGGIGGGGSGLAEEGLFDNPNGNTRVRGLSRADNTRNYFLTNVPWDGYNTNRVDLQRGPSAILFGLGSPAGVINASSTAANFSDDSGKFAVQTDQFGTIRLNADYNKVLIENELAVRYGNDYSRRSC